MRGGRLDLYWLFALSMKKREEAGKNKGGGGRERGAIRVVGKSHLCSRIGDSKLRFLLLKPPSFWDEKETCADRTFQCVAENACKYCVCFLSLILLSRIVHLHSFHFVPRRSRRELLCHPPYVLTAGGKILSALLMSSLTAGGKREVRTFRGLRKNVYIYIKHFHLSIRWRVSGDRRIPSDRSGVDACEAKLELPTLGGHCSPHWRPRAWGCHTFRPQ